MDFITVKDASSLWGITPRRIAVLCKQGRIKGAVKAAGVWILLSDAEKPADARIKSGHYIGWREKNKLAEYDCTQNIKNVEATLRVEGMQVSQATKDALVQMDCGHVSSQQIIEQIKQKYMTERG